MELQKKTKEILDLICVASKSDSTENTEAKLPDDLVKIVSTLQGNRIRNFDFERSDPELEEKIKRCMSEGKCQETVVTFQTFFEHMKLERDPVLAKRPVGDAVLWKLAVFDTFCSYLFKFNMYDEALEFLHMAIQKSQAIPRPEVDRSVIKHQFKMIRCLARSYCAIGDLKKSSHYMKLHKAFREHYDFLEKSDDFESEEVAIISLKSFFCTILNGEKEQKAQNDVEEFYLGGIEKYGRSPEFAERFKNAFVLITMQILYKIHVRMKSIKDINQAVTFAWYNLQTLFESRVALYEFLSDELNPEFKHSIGILLMICHHEIKRLWKQMDTIFPETENHEEVMHFSHTKDAQIIITSKIQLNKGKAKIDQEYESDLVQKITNPNYYSKLLVALREFHYRTFICKYWTVFRNGLPIAKKAKKEEKKKWRLFKNSASLILKIRGRFRQHQEKLTNEYQSLSTFSDPTMVSETDISDSDSESEPSNLEYVPFPSRTHISQKRSELEGNIQAQGDIRRRIVKELTGKDED